MTSFTDFQKAATRPRIVISGTRAAYFGPPMDLSPHRNAVATVAISVGNPFELQILEGLDACRSPEVRMIALVPPNTLHHLKASGPMAFLYLDATSDDRQGLDREDLEAAFFRLSGAQLPQRDFVPVSSLVDDLCSALGVPARLIIDPRIADAVRQIEERPQDFATVSQAARISGLSTSRFQHLFRASLGVPFRRYRLWRRMTVVMRRLDQGYSLTHAALDAGFSSSAHLSATFRAMFGIKPSSLLALGVVFEFADAS